MNSRAFLGRIVVLGTTATISLLGCLLLSYLSGCNPQEAVQEVTKTVKGVSKDWQKTAADY